MVVSSSTPKRMKKPLPSWVWPVVVAAIVLNAALFVYSGATETETHSWQERAVLTGSLVAGAAIIAIYWSRKWVRLRDSAKPGSPLVPGLPRRIGHGIIVTCAVALLVVLGSRLITFLPSYKPTEKFVQSSPAVAAVFGKIRNLSATGSLEVESGNSPSGSYDFYVEGDRGNGNVRAKWKEKDGKFDLFELDTVSSNDTATKIWSNEP
jgi:hypothetical protein